MSGLIVLLWNVMLGLIMVGVIFKSTPAQPRKPR